MTTAIINNHNICLAAMRKIGVTAIDEAPTADGIAEAMLALNRMLKSWQNRGFNLWTVTSKSLTLTTAASYAMTPDRPLEIQSARLNRSGVETPMQRFNREQYDTIPVKTSTGLPTCFYYNRQKETGTLFIWPVLAVAAGQTIELTYVRELADGTLTDNIDVPSEWYDATVYGLAARIADDYGVAAPNVVARAEEELRIALSYDREGSVYFVGDGYT